MKNTSIYKASHPSNIVKRMTRIASTGILLCHTLISSIAKDCITINSWFELSVLPTSTFIPKFRIQIHHKIWGKKVKYSYSESPIQNTEKDDKDSIYWYIILSHTYHHHREGLHNHQQLVWVVSVTYFHIHTKIQKSNPSQNKGWKRQVFIKWVTLPIYR